MKSIIMISDMNCENCAKEIQSVLESAMINFTLNLEKKMIVVEGNSDMVRNAKQVIANIGFTVV